MLAAGDFERENTINQEQFELIQVLADEAASAIENARLFQKERRRSSHLALLNELAQKAASVLNPNELLDSICGEVRSAFDRDLARIEVVDLQKNELVVEAQAGYGGELLGRRARCGEGLSGAAAMGREPVLANSVLRDLRYVALHPGVRSALSLPLRYRDDLLGVLSLESFREHSFSQQDVLTLQSLADQLAIALHNARAYQSALEQAITDGLTGLKTHRYFMEALDGEWRRSTRTGRPFSVIMMDLDGFKRVNDPGATWKAIKCWRLWPPCSMPDQGNPMWWRGMGGMSSPYSCLRQPRNKQKFWRSGCVPPWKRTTSCAPTG